MTANEAEQKAIERKPIYEKEELEKTLSVFNKRIESEISKGGKYIRGGWELYEIFTNDFRQKLIDDGYYVRYNYSMGVLDIIVAWGTESKKAFQDEDEKSKKYIAEVMAKKDEKIGFISSIINFFK